MLSPCTAAIPMPRPASLCRHGAGNASIAATSTIVASTPLHPASIDTANPFAVERNTLPADTTLLSNSVTVQADTRASAVVQGTANQSCAQGVSSRPNRIASSTTNDAKKRNIGGEY